MYTLYVHVCIYCIAKSLMIHCTCIIVHHVYTYVLCMWNNCKYVANGCDSYVEEYPSLGEPHTSQWLHYQYYYYGMSSSKYTVIVL